MANKMTVKQKAFCDEYVKSGNATKSYMIAYGTENEKTAAVNAARMLRNAKVVEYLNTYEKKLDKKRIASVEDVQEWWSDILLGTEGADIKDRLKASELLVKSRGGFIEKMSHSFDEESTQINIRFGDKSKRKNFIEKDPVIVDGGALKDDNEG